MFGVYMNDDRDHGSCQAFWDFSPGKQVLPTVVARSAASELNERVVQGHKRPLHEGFPQRLRQLRKRSGLTQSALGLLVQWRSGVDLLESGKQAPAIDTIERFAVVLGVPAAWLAYGDEAMLPFRQRQPRPVIAPEPPNPEPAQRESSGRWKGMHTRLRQARIERGMSLGSVAKEAAMTKVEKNFFIIDPLIVL